jgi:hypothetical protein
MSNHAKGGLGGFIVALAGYYAALSSKSDERVEGVQRTTSAASEHVEGLVSTAHRDFTAFPPPAVPPGHTRLEPELARTRPATLPLRRWSG